MNSFSMRLGSSVNRGCLHSVPSPSVRKASMPTVRNSPPFRPVQLTRENSKMQAVSREDDPDLEAFKNALNDAEGEGTSKSVAVEDKENPDVLTGEELVELIREKWGARYDCRISRQRDGVNNLRFYLQIMWKFLEQKSFPLSEEEYYEQLDAVASLVTEWGLAEHVRNEIKNSKKNPVIGHTIGGGAKCVSIPLLDADDVQM